MRRFIVVLCIATAVVSCKKSETVTGQPATTTTAATATTAADPTQPSLISFSAGALVVQKPQEYGDSWSAFWMFDGRPSSGWATPKDVLTPQTTVVALPERTQLDRLAFDTGAVDGAGRGAKDVVVEMSDESATTGFQKIAAVTLQDKLDNQSFPVSAEVPGRWLRVTVQNNHGATDYIELFEVHGYGKQLTQTAGIDASGTYSTNYGNFHLRQEGTSVTGCYEHAGGTLTGGIERRVMRFTWRQTGNNNGPAIMVFSPDGKEMFGLWWREGQTDATGGVWNGKRISDEVGSCPHWSGGAEAQMTKELEDFGRTRVYGINFDTDSNVIKDESKPTLDKIVAVLKAQPDWKLKIEGHTDSSGNDNRNRQLSQSRADAVKAYIVAAGVEGARLTTAGLGSSKPVAENKTASGRGQNRRVELAKE